MSTQPDTAQMRIHAEWAQNDGWIDRAEELRGAADEIERLSGLVREERIRSFGEIDRLVQRVRVEQERADQADSQVVQIDAVSRAFEARAVQAEARVRDYEHQISWDTTCSNCARMLDASYADTMRAERAEAALVEAEQRPTAQAWNAMVERVAKAETTLANLRTELARIRTWEDDFGHEVMKAEDVRDVVQATGAGLPVTETPPDGRMCAWCKQPVAPRRSGTVHNCMAGTPPEASQ